MLTIKLCVAKKRSPVGFDPVHRYVCTLDPLKQNNENEILCLYHDVVIINFTPEVHFDHVLCIAHLHLHSMIQLNRAAVCSFKDSSLSILL